MRAPDTLCLAGAAALAATLVLPGAGAQAAAAPKLRTLERTVTDPAGDSAQGSFDLRKVTVRYRSDGRLRVVVTTAAAIDPAKVDGVVTVTLSRSSCDRYVLGASATFSLADTPSAFTYATQTKVGALRDGTGRLGARTYTMTFDHRALRGLKPTCVQTAIVDPDADPAVVYDETRAVTLR